MLKRITMGRRIPAVAGAVIVVAIIGGGTATAANLITGKDIKNGSVGTADIKNGSLKVKDLTPKAVKTLQKHGTAAAGATGSVGATGATGARGPQGPQGPKGDDATYVGPNWSIVDRNVIGGGDSYLRAGLDGAPLGQGSLGIRTGAPSDKAAFGNQVDFLNVAVADLAQVGFSVYTTVENTDGKDGHAASTSINMPSISFEIDPNLSSTASNFSSLVFVPNNTKANAWTIDRRRPRTRPASGF